LLRGKQGLWAALERSRRAQSAERPPFNVDFRGKVRMALRKFINDAKQSNKAFTKSVAALPQENVRRQHLREGEANMKTFTAQSISLLFSSLPLAVCSLPSFSPGRS